MAQRSIIALSSSRCSRRGVLVAIALVVSSAMMMVVAADNCSITVPNAFYMVLGASADTSQDVFPLYYSDVPMPGSVTASSGPSVALYCNDEAKTIAIMTRAGYEAAYSNPVAGTGFPEVKFSSGCAVEVLFNVRKLDSFKYKLTNADGDCLATALDTPDNLVQLVNCSNETTMYASASLSWKNVPIQTPDGKFPASAYWTVDIADGSPASNLLIIAMMAIKRNNAMGCVPTPAPPVAPAPTPGGISSAAVIVIAVLISGFLSVGVFLGLRHVYKRADYAELRQTINESHEA